VDAEPVRGVVQKPLNHRNEPGGGVLVDWIQPPLKGLQGEKRDAVDMPLGYFHSRTGMTAYPSCRNNTWQLVTGMIESTARQLVAVRLKGTGMHSAKPGASAITTVKTNHINRNSNQLRTNHVIP
jgi:hypothetical protein